MPSLYIVTRTRHVYGPDPDPVQILYRPSPSLPLAIRKANKAQRQQDSVPYHLSHNEHSRPTIRVERIESHG